MESNVVHDLAMLHMKNKTYGNATAMAEDYLLVKQEIEKALSKPKLKAQNNITVDEDEEEVTEKENFW